MKAAVLALALLSGSALAENCRMQETSQMTTQRTVGAVVNLTKDKSHNQCRVRYQLNVDGKLHNVEWTQKGLYQEEILCQMAIRNGTNDLLVKLPGHYRTESVISCKEKTYPKLTSRGYEGEEVEFGYHPMNKQYRRMGTASNCRFFQDWAGGGNYERTQGVICENNNNLWTVVDKF